MKCFIDEYTFERMINMSDVDAEDTESYEEFIEWNVNCLSELSDARKAWLIELCKGINSNYIKLVDEESCAEMTASNIYFNKKKNLCIVNPR